MRDKNVHFVGGVCGFVSIPRTTLLYDTLVWGLFFRTVYIITKNLVSVMLSVIFILGLCSLQDYRTGSGPQIKPFTSCLERS